MYISASLRPHAEQLHGNNNLIIFCKFLIQQKQILVFPPRSTTALSTLVLAIVLDQIMNVFKASCCQDICYSYRKIVAVRKYGTHFLKGALSRYFSLILQC